MFNLEDQLQQWRKALMSLEPVRSTSNIDDLEQHVRDSVGTLTSLGLSQEEAFVLAMHRIGTPAVLAREFARANRSYLWSHRVFWITTGALAYVVCGLIIGALASLSQVLVSILGGHGAAVAYTAIGTSALGWGSLAALLYHRRGPDSWLQHTSAGVVASGVACAVAIATLINLGSQWILVRVMPVQELAWAQLISHMSTIAATAMMPFVLLSAMLLVARRLRDTGVVNAY